MVKVAAVHPSLPRLASLFWRRIFAGDEGIVGDIE